MQDRSKLVKEWYDKASHDLIAAHLLFRENGPADMIAVHLQQAAEKYLKGYLISKGWHLKKTHDLGELINEANKYNPGFNDFIKLGDLLTALYISEKYPSPPNIENPEKTLPPLIQQTEKLISLIKSESK